jgi:stage IV sporulation protein FB
MGNPMLLFIAIFVYVAAGAEAQDAGFRDVAHGLTAAEGMETRVATLSVDARLDQAVDALLASAQHDFPIVDGAGRPVGLLTREALLAALKENDGARPIIDLIAAAPPIVAARLDLTEAVEALRRSGGQALLVVDAAGRVAGMLTQQNVAEMMMVRAARPDWRFARR